VTDEPAARLIRAFVAIELEDRTRTRLAELIESLRDRIRGVRWVRPEGIHLTLRFLGYARKDVLEALRPALRQAAGNCPASTAIVSGLGTFPESGRARVIWIALSVAPSVLRLQEACERAAVACGFEAKTRAFRPHLTLGRWKEPARRPPLPEVDLGPPSLATLVLFRSQPGTRGSVYTPIEAFALAPPEAAPA